jgi:VWFA-related protein
MTRKLLAVVFFTAFTITAQETPRLRETVEVSIVNVDVIVTDRKGNRVHGLSQDDFEILENGKPQPVSNFAEYTSDDPDARVGVAGGVQPAGAQQEKRTFLIFFEKTQLTGFAADAIAEALKKTIAEVIRPGDSVSVVYWSRHDIEHFDAGDDPAKIAEAIGFLNRKAKTIHLNERDQFLQETAAQRDLRSGMQSNGRRGQSAPALEASELNLNLTMQMAYHEMVQRVAAINASINSIAGVDGKKILLLAPRRLGEVAGAEFVFHGGAMTIPQQLRTMYRTTELIRSIVDNANAAGITIYPIYPEGLEGAGGVADQLTYGNETLSLAGIAEETGGLSAAGEKGIVNLLPRIATDATNYYSLAYRVRSDGTDRARDVAVKVRNPEFTVRARKQFVEKSDDTRMRDRLRATLFRANEDTDIDIAVLTGKAKKSRRTYTVPVEVKIPVAQLTMLQQGADKHAGSFSVYIGVATELNELSDVTQKTQPFEVTAAQLDKALASHFTYEMDVQVNGASKYLAVGVFDEVGRTYGLRRIELEQKK